MSVTEPYVVYRIGCDLSTGEPLSPDQQERFDRLLERSARRAKDDEFERSEFMQWFRSKQPPAGSWPLLDAAVQKLLEEGRF